MDLHLHQFLLATQGLFSQGFCDVNWATSVDRKSISVFCVYRRGNLIHWRSRKQKVLARSSI